MKPIEPFELSGYLDGELEPDRVRELEAVLARDPALRAEYEALANADREWKSTARLAAFVPDTQVRFSKPFTHSPLGIATGSGSAGRIANDAEAKRCVRVGAYPSRHCSGDCAAMGCSHVERRALKIKTQPIYKIKGEGYRKKLFSCGTPHPPLRGTLSLRERELPWTSS